MSRLTGKLDDGRERSTIEYVNDKAVSRFGSFDSDRPREIVDLGEVDVLDIVAV